MTPDEFLKMARKYRITGRGIAPSIRKTMAEVLGELAAVSALAYAGDAGDDNLAGFVARLDELLGESARVVLGSIMEQVEKERKERSSASEKSKRAG
jgi:hypothetical protein